MLAQSLTSTGRLKKGREALFFGAAIEIATLVTSMQSIEQLEKKSTIKVVLDADDYALYFSRQVIPGIARDDSHDLSHYNQHVGTYAYRRDVLQLLVNLPPSPLEQLESLEQLRWMENGYRIKVGRTDHKSISVDTPEDLITIKRLKLG